MEGRIQQLCLAGKRTEADAASRTHFYGSEIRVNVPKGCYDTFSKSSAMVGPNSSQET